MKLKITMLDGTSTATHKIVSNPIRVRAHAGRGASVTWVETKATLLSYDHLVLGG